LKCDGAIYDYVFGKMKIRDEISLFNTYQNIKIIKYKNSGDLLTLQIKFKLFLI